MILILAGVTTVAYPLAGRIVADPAYDAWMIRDGPAGNVVIQLPSAAVVTAPAGVNAFEPLSGAIRMLTVCPARGCPWLSINRPRTVTGEP